MSTIHRLPGGGDAMGGLLQAVWRYKRLLAAAVLLGALFGYGWAARQPTLYEGVSPVVMAGRCPPDGQCGPFRSPPQLMRSSAVLERAVKLSGNRISADTLGQRLQVDVAQDADLVTIRVVDSTQSRKVVEHLRRVRGGLETSLARVEGELAGRPNDDRLEKKREALSAQLSEVRRQLRETRSARIIVVARAAVPEQPIQPRPGRTVAIGMLFGLLASAVLVWWRTRRQGPTASAPEQGPEVPSPA